MATYKNQAVVNYPINEVFRVFKKTAKRDFPKFNEKSPIGTRVERTAGAYSVRNGKVFVEITDYKPNEVYEITTTHDNILYKSRYEFYSIDENKTKIMLFEENHSSGYFNSFNVFVAGLFFKSRVRKRFDFLVKGLKEQVERTSVIKELR
ncbi:hypothetical protein HMPREF1982_01041 [Clostridiales bacterium oral taxon 876 str. F0540]|nr:hypothetical protein HMPREF1982_01041 [Clostridiales bacterium oral taxon 876 str. F0540]